VTQISQVYKRRSMEAKEVRGPRIEMQNLLNLIEDADYVS